MVGHRSGGRLAAVFVVAVCATVIEAGLASLALLFDVLQDDDRARSIVALGAAATGAVASVVGIGAQDGGRRATVVALVVIASQVVVTGVVGAIVVAYAADWRALGVNGGSIAVYGALGVAAAALAVWTATTLPARRWALGALSATVATLAAAVTVTAAGVAAEVTGADCERFAFDGDRWRDGAADPGFGATSDRERIAATLRHCEVLDGQTRTAVRALLGRPGRSRRRADEWHIGSTNDVAGPGDGDALVVRYDGAMRVTSVRRLSR